MTMCDGAPGAASSAEAGKRSTTRRGVANFACVSIRDAAGVA